MNTDFFSAKRSLSEVIKYLSLEFRFGPEVEDQANFKRSRLQIIEKLSFVLGADRLCCLDLDNYLVFGGAYFWSSA